MLSIRWGFGVVVAALIAIGAADPAHAVSVTVTANGTNCGTVTGATGATSVGWNIANCAGVATSGTLTATDSGTTRKWSMSSLRIKNNRTSAQIPSSASVTIAAIHTYAGAADPYGGLSISARFYRTYTANTRAANGASGSFSASIQCGNQTPQSLGSVTKTAISTTDFNFSANAWPSNAAGPIPLNACSQAQTIRGTLTVVLPFSATVNTGDELRASASANVFSGDDQVTVKTNQVSSMLQAKLWPSAVYTPNTRSNINVVLFCKPPGPDGEPTGETGSVPFYFNPPRTGFGATSFGAPGAPDALRAFSVGNPATADLNGDQCSDYRFNFDNEQAHMVCPCLDQVTGIPRGGEATLKTRASVCVNETTVTKVRGQTVTTDDPMCDDQDIEVDVPLDVSAACPTVNPLPVCQ